MRLWAGGNPGRGAPGESWSQWLQARSPLSGGKHRGQYQGCKEDIERSELGIGTL